MNRVNKEIYKVHLVPLVMVFLYGFVRFRVIDLYAEFNSKVLYFAVVLAYIIVTTAVADKLWVNKFGKAVTRYSLIIVSISLIVDYILLIAGTILNIDLELPWYNDVAYFIVFIFDINLGYKVGKEIKSLDKYS